MTRVTLIGFVPGAVDFSDPSLPPGITAEKIRDGIELGLQKMRDRGWDVDFCIVPPDDGAGPAVERHLAAKAYDCVVIGRGVRLAQTKLTIFEAIVNAVRRAAPTTPIAFNTLEDTADAAARWVGTTLG